MAPGKGREEGYSDEWYTPPEMVAALGAFDLDPCAGPMRHAAENWGRDVDGLSREWRGRVWMNPPYSNVHEWLARFVAHGNGVALVSARPETRWFQKACAGASGVLWIRGRVEFMRPDGRTTHLPVGNALIGYGDQNGEALASSGLAGLMMRRWGIG